jgi:hypothetical protein
MKQATHIYIVGNRLIEFAKNPGVYTVDKFLSLVEAERNAKPKAIYEIHFGQGLSDGERECIYKAVENSGVYEHFICNHQLSYLKRANSSLTHKHHDANTMISEPVRITDSLYESYLMLDERCAEMSDHLTGEHIQGAVLMEAARQMTLAVTEKFFIDSKDYGKVSFVSNSVETKFLSYAFPIDIKIEYKIVKHRGMIKNNNQFKVQIRFFQCEREVTQVTYTFSTLDKCYIKIREQTAVSEVFNQMINKKEVNYAKINAAA